MSTDHKHAYRFVYLKSEEWQSVRVEALVRDKMKCQICDLEDFYNDAHHVYYPPSFWKTTVEHLVVLCRDCHELTHSLIPKVKGKTKEESIEDWNAVVSALTKWRKIKIPEVNPKISTPCPECRACGVEGFPVKPINALQKYPDASFKVMWHICEKCHTRMMDEVDWPKKFSQGPVFIAIRKWAKKMQNELNTQTA